MRPRYKLEYHGENTQCLENYSTQQSPSYTSDSLVGFTRPSVPAPASPTWTIPSTIASTPTLPKAASPYSSGCFDGTQLKSVISVNRFSDDSTRKVPEMTNFVFQGACPSLHQFAGNQPCTSPKYQPGHSRSLVYTSPDIITKYSSCMAYNRFPQNVPPSSYTATSKTGNNLPYSAAQNLSAHNHFTVCNGHPTPYMKRQPHNVQQNNLPVNLPQPAALVQQGSLFQKSCLAFSPTAHHRRNSNVAEIQGYLSDNNASPNQTEKDGRPNAAAARLAQRVSSTRPHDHAAKLRHPIFNSTSECQAAHKSADTISVTAKKVYEGRVSSVSRPTAQEVLHPRSFTAAVGQGNTHQTLFSSNVSRAQSPRLGGLTPFPLTSQDTPNRANPNNNNFSEYRYYVLRRASDSTGCVPQNSRNECLVPITESYKVAPSPHISLKSVTHNQLFSAGQKAFNKEVCTVLSPTSKTVLGKAGKRSSEGGPVAELSLRKFPLENTHSVKIVECAVDSANLAQNLAPTSCSFQATNCNRSHRAMTTMCAITPGKKEGSEKLGMNSFCSPQYSHVPALPLHQDYAQASLAKTPFSDVQSQHVRQMRWDVTNVSLTGHEYPHSQQFPVEFSVEYNQPFALESRKQQALGFLNYKPIKVTNPTVAFPSRICPPPRMYTNNSQKGNVVVSRSLSKKPATLTHCAQPQHLNLIIQRQPGENHLLQKSSAPNINLRLAGPPRPSITRFRETERSIAKTQTRLKERYAQAAPPTTGAKSFKCSSSSKIMGVVKHEKKIDQNVSRFFFKNDTFERTSKLNVVVPTMAQSRPLSSTESCALMPALRRENSEKKNGKLSVEKKTTTHQSTSTSKDADAQQHNVFSHSIEKTEVSDDTKISEAYPKDIPHSNLEPATVLNNESTLFLPIGYDSLVPSVSQFEQQCEENKALRSIHYDHLRESCLLQKTLLSETRSDAHLCGQASCGRTMAEQHQLLPVLLPGRDIDVGSKLLPCTVDSQRENSQCRQLTKHSSEQHTQRGSAASKTFGIRTPNGGLPGVSSLDTEAVQEQQMTDSTTILVDTAKSFNIHDNHNEAHMKAQSQAKCSGEGEKEEPLNEENGFTNLVSHDAMFTPHDAEEKGNKAKCLLKNNDDKRITEPLTQQNEEQAVVTVQSQYSSDAITDNAMFLMPVHDDGYRVPRQDMGVGKKCSAPHMDGFEMIKTLGHFSEMLERDVAFYPRPSLVAQRQKQLRKGLQFGWKYTSEEFRKDVYPWLSRFTQQQKCETRRINIGGYERDIQRQLVVQLGCGGAQQPSHIDFDVWSVPYYSPLIPTGSDYLRQRLGRFVEKRRIQTTARQFLEHVFLNENAFSHVLGDHDGDNISKNAEAFGTPEYPWQSTILLPENSAVRWKALRRLYAHILRQAELLRQSGSPSTAGKDIAKTCNLLEIQQLHRVLVEYELWPPDLSVDEQKDILMYINNGVDEFSTPRCISETAFTRSLLALPYNLPDHPVPSPQDRSNATYRRTLTDKDILVVALNVCSVVLDVVVTPNTLQHREWVAEFWAALAAKQSVPSESKSHDGGSLSVISRKARELATQRLIQLATAGFGLLGLPPKHFYHQDSCRSEIISVEELQTLLLLNRWPYEESEQFRIRKKCSNLNEDTLSSANGQVLNTFVQWKPHDEDLLNIRVISRCLQLIIRTAIYAVGVANREFLIRPYRHNVIVPNLTHCADRSTTLQQTAELDHTRVPVSVKRRNTRSSDAQLGTEEHPGYPPTNNDHSRVLESCDSTPLNDRISAKKTKKRNQTVSPLLINWESFLNVFTQDEQPLQTIPVSTSINSQLKENPVLHDMLTQTSLEATFLNVWSALGSLTNEHEIVHTTLPELISFAPLDVTSLQACCVVFQHVACHGACFNRPVTNVS